MLGGRCSYSPCLCSPISCSTPDIFANCLEIGTGEVKLTYATRNGKAVRFGSCVFIRYEPTSILPIGEARRRGL